MYSGSGTRVIIAVVASLFLASLVLFVSMTFQVRASGEYWDFGLFWRQVQTFDSGGPLYYFDNIEIYKGGTHTYKFPPLYAMLLLIQVKMHQGVAAAPLSVLNIQWLIQMGSYLAAITLWIVTISLNPLRRPCPKRWTPRVGLWLGGMSMASLAFIHRPFFETIKALQLETPVLLLLTLTMFLLAKKYDAGAGIAWGLAVALKIYPAVFLVFFLLEKRYRVVAWATVTNLVVVILSVLVIGLNEVQGYFLKVVPFMVRQPAELGGYYWENASIAKYVMLVTGIEGQTGKLIASLLFLLIFGITLVVVYRDGRRKTACDTETLRYAIFAPVMLLAMADQWANYQGFLLIPIVLVVGRYFTRTGQGLVAMGQMVAWTLLVYAGSGHIRGLAALLVWGTLIWILGRIQPLLHQTRGRPDEFHA